VRIRARSGQRSIFLNGKFYSMDDRTFITVDDEVGAKLLSINPDICLHRDNLPKGVVAPILTTKDSPIFVVIPTRGRADHLRKTLKEVISQNPDGIIVINDGAQDNTDSVVALHGDKVRLIKNPGRLGINASRGAGNGCVPDNGIVVELDDHDLLLPNALNAIREAFFDPFINLVYGDCEFYGKETGNFIKPDYISWQLRDDTCYATGVRAYRKFVYNVAGGYRVGRIEEPAGDYNLFLRIEALSGGVGIKRIPKKLSIVMKSGDGVNVGLQDINAEKFRGLARSGKLLGVSELHGKKSPISLTIVVVTHNYGMYLPRALSSIFSQTMLPSRVIVVDDSSDKKDSARNVAAMYPTEYIKTNFRNGNKARNVGARRCTEDAILFLDADDWLLPTFIETFMDSMKKTGVDVVYSKWHSFKDSNGSFKLIENHYDGAHPNHPRDGQLLRHMNYIAMPSLIRMSKFPGFDNDILVGQDWDLWWAMMRNGCSFEFIPEEMFCVFIHENSVSQQSDHLKKLEIVRQKNIALDLKGKK